MPVRYRALCTKQRFLPADTNPRGSSARIGGEVIRPSLGSHLPLGGTEVGTGVPVRSWEPVPAHMVPPWALANMQPENACCEVAWDNTSVSRSKRVACGTSNADRPGTRWRVPFDSAVADIAGSG